MVVDRVSGKFQSSSGRRYGRDRQDIQQSQRTIYNFLLEIVRKWPPKDVLEEFKNLFFHHSETVSSETVPALYAIVFSNNQAEFHNTLKRSCYILINNWEVAREHEAVQELIRMFSDPVIRKTTLSPTLKRLRQWIASFVTSGDFRDLELFVANRFASPEENWVNRYTSYLLVSQYVDTGNPLEQREAARTMSRRLKDKFKFDLAMYTAYSQTARPVGRNRHNPTVLGDGTLRLVKAIVAKRGQFSYRNLARIFQDQTQSVTYRSYKRSLMGYLLFSVSEPDTVKVLKQSLTEKLDRLYRKHDKRVVDRSLTLRTSNRLIDYLMTEDQQHPSPLFTMLLSKGNPLTMAVLLLKVVLISPNSHPYLEARIADLIRYYEQFPRNECQWIINFLEIYSVTFAIYSSDVEYSLVKIRSLAPGASPASRHQASHNGHQNGHQNGHTQRDSLDDYRVFSQMLKANHSNPERGAEDDMLPVEETIG
ncbi:MAG: hypothetical protein AAFZ80_01105 [Cyanobacteria bacterium P01_A01_bin.105]